LKDSLLRTWKVLAEMAMILEAAHHIAHCLESWLA